MRRAILSPDIQQQPSIRVSPLSIYNSVNELWMHVQGEEQAQLTELKLQSAGTLSIDLKRPLWNCSEKCEFMHKHDLFHSLIISK